ncbi:hypothetical protein Tco_0920174, partial [Tanacetum coccineum]
MADLSLLEELGEVTGSSALHDRMRIWFCRCCLDTTERIVKRQKFIEQLQVLSNRGVALDYVDRLKSIQMKELEKLRILNGLLVDSGTCVPEREAYVLDIDGFSTASTSVSTGSRVSTVSREDENHDKNANIPPTQQTPHTLSTIKLPILKK